MTVQKKEEENKENKTNLNLGSSLFISDKNTNPKVESSSDKTQNSNLFGKPANTNANISFAPPKENKEENKDQINLNTKANENVSQNNQNPTEINKTNNEGNKN